MQYVETEEVTSREDEGMCLLLQLNDKINELRKKTGEDGASLPKKTVQDPHLVDANENTPEKTERENASPNVETSQKFSYVHPLYRRDLKITGPIGEPHQKDRLTYTSLERQIQKALAKGYDETEVVEAVIQAIAPGTKLKSYLESRVDLSLQALRQV